MIAVVEELIDDDEWLYRSFPVPDNRGSGLPEVHYKEIDGQLRLERGVWRDSNFRPSVDREKLVHSLEDIKFNRTDAVVKIRAEEVREISGRPLLDVDQTGRTHDVFFDKKEDRPAHTLIVTDPPFANKPNAEKNRWKMFQSLLSLAAAKHGLVKGERGHGEGSQVLT